MAGPGTTFRGPLISGDKFNPDANGPANTGLAELGQTITLTQNGTNTVTGSLVVPYGSQLTSFNVDVTTAWNSGSGDTLTIGSAAGGSQYAGGISVATAGRIAPTYTAAELAAMLNVGANTTVYFTVTPAGTAATAGTVIITMKYYQTVQPTAGAA